MSLTKKGSETAPAGPSLKNARVLLVDDELLILLLLEDMLEDFGCRIAGNASRPEEALGIIEAQDIDVAVLDVNLSGVPSYAVADALDQRKIPYLFVTGYQKSAMDARFRDRPRLSKPFSQEDLERALKDALKNSRS